MSEIKKHPHRRHNHKKRTVRFISFFLFLIAFGVIEDMSAMYLNGIDFNMVILTTVIIIATVFTAIAEITEYVFKKEEPKIEKFVQKEGKIIKKDEKLIKNKIVKVKVKII
jgi:hypothetical protein